MSTRTLARFAVIVAVCTVVATSSLLAHHSFTAEFDATKPVTLKGKITKMLWTNPHGWLYIDVKGPDGKVVNWALEFGAPYALYKRGWRQKDLPVGADVTVEGWLAKDGSNTANAGKVSLADGRQLFAGSSGGPGAGTDQ